MDFDVLDSELGAWADADVEAAEREINLATSSASLPDIPNKKNKTNWVEKAGGLPKYIERIAKHLRSEKGMDTSRAIATAVNTVKRWCSSGQTAEGQKGGVSAKTKALACKAVAQWEAKKKKAKADLSATPQPDKIVLLPGSDVFVYESDVEPILQLSAAAALDVDWGEFDSGQFALALSQARRGESLNLAITFDWDPDEHPRDTKGRFRDTLAQMAKGDVVDLQDGVTVERTDDGYVTRWDRADTSTGAQPGATAQSEVKWKTAEAAAESALDHSAQRDNESSFGGTRKIGNGLSQAIREADAKPFSGKLISGGKNPRKDLATSLEKLKPGDVVRMPDGSVLQRREGLGDFVIEKDDRMRMREDAQQAADTLLIESLWDANIQPADYTPSGPNADFYQGRPTVNWSSKADVAKAARAFVQEHKDRGDDAPDIDAGPDDPPDDPPNTNAPEGSGSDGNEGGEGTPGEIPPEDAAELDAIAGNLEEAASYFGEDAEVHEEYGPEPMDAFQGNERVSDFADFIDGAEVPEDPNDEADLILPGGTRVRWAGSPDRPGDLEIQRPGSSEWEPAFDNEQTDE